MGSTAPNTLELVIWGPLERADLSGLCARVCARLQASGAQLVVCDVGGVGADAVAVDALARLQLAAQRNGCQVRMLGASEELRELVALMGLGDVLNA
jgi:ABC-type transporter Mla MlaB component